MAPWIEKLLEEGKALLASLRTKVTNLFNSSVDAVELAAEENKDKVEGDIVQFFEDTAMDGVRAASLVPGDWTVKLAAAVAAITADFALKGLAVGKNVIVTLALSAYTKFKVTQPEVAAVIDAVVEKIEPQGA